ncbi:MAG: hypothetical protein KGH61_00255 [Candidatus Micrarchaeota archaeon]|nr:hypothetical protein [Candidatus Micrarchaeota archaeon]MDE1847368.1 hypothetical protein [Candidatus Micrarchaeota archaeon]MDE1863983.1 hypothetical protein [Candidatus Micrarchaeota archaeon]
MYTPDKQYSGNSTCYGGCARVWPIFYTSSLVLPPSLKSLNFSTITRTDGSKQLTYLGYPLYYYAGDTKAGDISGQNVGHIWYLMGVSGPIMAPIFQGKPSISTTPPNSTTTVGTISSSNNGGTIGSSRPNTSTSVSHGTTAQTPTGNNSGVVSSLLLYAGIVIVMVLIIVGLWFMLRKKL